MDKLAKYRQIVQEVLQEYVAAPVSHGQIDSQTIFDIAQDHYQVLDIGWDKNRRVHDCALHIDIIDGKIWVQYNMTEMPITSGASEAIAQKLLSQGVARGDIVFSFEAPCAHKYSGFALV